MMESNHQPIDETINSAIMHEKERSILTDRNELCDVEEIGIDCKERAEIDDYREEIIDKQENHERNNSSARKTCEEENRANSGVEANALSKYVYIYAFCAALNSCNLGYDIGVNTQAGIYIQESMNLSDVQIEMFMGSLNLYAIAGALGAQFISDKFGRRKTFLIAAIGFVLGIVIMSLSNNYSMLMFGRVFVGLGLGFGLAIDPVYIAEISPAAHRGRLVTWSEIAINVGILLGFFSGLFFYEFDADIAWRGMFAMGAILPVGLMLLVVKVMPESPRWLVQRNREVEATEILKKIYGQGFDVDKLVNEIKDSIAMEEAAANQVGWDVLLFPTPAYRRMMLVGFVTAISQQLVGIDAIVYFLVYILEESGIVDKKKQIFVLVVLGIVKLVFIVVAGNIFDKKGRKPMMFISLFGMATALFSLSFLFWTGQGALHGGITIVFLAQYLACFSIGMGPGTWLVTSEIFSLTIRAKAMSVATFLNRVGATIMSSSFLSLANALTWGGFFALLGMVCCFVGLFFIFFLPETKGIALEDIHRYFAEVTGDKSILNVHRAKANTGILA